MLTVAHVHFGDVAQHPIIQNYLRTAGQRRHIVVMPRPRRNKVVRLMQLIGELVRLRLAAGPVIVHAHDVATAAVAAVLFPRRVIFDSHEIYSSLARGKAMRCLVGSLERYVAAHVDLVIYPSPQRRDHFGSVRRRRTAVVENLFLPHQESGSTPEVLRELDRCRARVRRGRGRRFIYAGTMTRVRAVEEIIAAFSEPSLESDTLFLAGRRTSLLEGWLASAPRNVEYLGELPHAVMVGLLPEFDAGFALYRPDNANNALAAPTKLFEFTYYGLEVIANASRYVIDVKSRMGLANVQVTDDCTPASIVRAASAVRGAPVPLDERVRSAVTWPSQTGLIADIYQTLDDPVVAVVSP